MDGISAHVRSHVGQAVQSQPILDLLLPLLIAVLTQILGGCLRGGASRAEVEQKISEPDFWTALAARRAVNQANRELSRGQRLNLRQRRNVEQSLLEACRTASPEMRAQLIDETAMFAIGPEGE